jgi:hypothetical protein
MSPRQNLCGMQATVSAEQRMQIIDSSDSSYYKLSLRGSKVIFFYFPPSKCVITNISAEKPL